jgi:hypothetical protein
MSFPVIAEYHPWHRNRDENDLGQSLNFVFDKPFLPQGSRLQRWLCRGQHLNLDPAYIH